MANDFFVSRAAPVAVAIARLGPRVEIVQIRSLGPERPIGDWSWRRHVGRWTSDAGRTRHAGRLTAGTPDASSTSSVGQMTSDV